jgi:hypothetical protein
VTHYCSAPPPALLGLCTTLHGKYASRISLDGEFQVGRENLIMSAHILLCLATSEALQNAG